MSAWNQWFIAAPMMIIERPWVFSALVANSRATCTILSRETPVMVSAQAGVYGVVSSSLDATFSPPKPRSTP